MREDGYAENRFLATASLLAQLRDALPRINSATARLEVIDLSLLVEAEHFRAASVLRADLAAAPRSKRVAFLRAAGLAAYGTGLLNARLHREMKKTLNTLLGRTVRLDAYLAQMNYLGRIPGWGTQGLRMHFFESMEKLANIEPSAMLFIQDQLRGSPLLFYAKVLDGLAHDASRQAGVQHQLFGEPIGFGLTALNSGLATGVLQLRTESTNLQDLRPDGIYVLPETVSDLPPIAGILTAGEGNPLSHVQLLARNLGIPNVSVDTSVLDTLARHQGERVVLAVSRSGQVELAKWSKRWNEVFDGANAEQGVRIDPDLDKLDLSVQNFIPLDTLRAADSGRIVGPKAAKLGELHAHYPGRVARGLAIPFGRFRREVLERPHPGGGTVFDWTVKRYRKLEEFAADDTSRNSLTQAFRAELYGIVSSTNPGQSFRDELKVALNEVFGTGPLPGIFVRSDTNVEDLPGFTGAGLNLTLPNVVGFDELVQSIVEVWASPFTARAFAWRQSYMTRPEHVYTSILLLESVASDKSGVLVTQDIDSGDNDVLSVAVNEGVGGAVDGQAAESLRIPLDGSPVRVLATSTAPWRRVLDPRGGLKILPSSGSDTVLQPAEIDQLIDLAKGLPQTFPRITDDEGKPAPMDIEFGFVNGQLRLFQLRPFLENKRARGIGYLQAMETRLQATQHDSVDMSEVPE
jgi:hypothetical protein